MNALNATRSTIRIGTVVLMGTLVIGATITGFAQSYAALYRWALSHELAGWKAESFPMLVDTFIAVGELGLFLLALDSHKLRRTLMSWTDLVIPAVTATAGWSVSLWFNVQHIKTHDVETKVTAGVPPVTAMIGLVILLRTVHRYMERADAAKAATNAPQITSVPTSLRLTVNRPAGEPAPVNGAHVVKAAERPAEPSVAAPVAPALEPAKTPAPAAEPAKTNGHGGRQAAGLPEGIQKAMRNPKWGRAVALYRDSVTSNGRPLSQRDLASALDMANRQLAAAAIRYVNEYANEN